MFTNSWFEITAKDNFEKYIPKDITSALEIGCYEGQASVWILENTKADLTVIDTFKGSKEHDPEFEGTLFARFSSNIEPYKDRVKVITGMSRDGLRALPAKETYDFIYIDGSHQASDVLEDAILAFPLLKINGMIIFDDYTWGVGMGYYDIPKPGIDAFLNVYGDKVKVFEKNSQVVIVKVGS